MTLIRTSSLTGALLALGIAGAALAQDQPAPSPTLELDRRHTAYAIVTSAESLASRIVFVESIGLLSEHGDWPEETPNWSADVPKFLYDVHNLSRRMAPELVSLRRAAARAGIFSDDERARVEQMLDELERLIGGALQLYDLLAAGQTQEANAFFSANSRAPYANVVAASYTLGTQISRDISRIALAARIAR